MTKNMRRAEDLQEIVEAFDERPLSMRHWDGNDLFRNIQSSSFFSESFKASIQDLIMDAKERGIAEGIRYAIGETSSEVEGLRAKLFTEDEIKSRAEMRALKYGNSRYGY
jgi:hypothetical protein